MQDNSVSQLLLAKRAAPLAGQAHPFAASARRRRAAGLREPTRFTFEGLAAAERLRVDAKQEHRCAPMRLAVRTAEARKPRGERLDQQAEREAFVAELDAAEGQDRAATS